MRILDLRKGKIGVSSLSGLYEDGLKNDQIDLEQLKWQGKRLSKAEAARSKTSRCAYDLQKLLLLQDRNEYLAGCVEAIMVWSIQKVSAKDSNVDAWLSNYESNGNIMVDLQTFVANYILCGNGFLEKTRDLAGKWIGLSRLLPNEMRIVEYIDDPLRDVDYIQAKAGKKTMLENRNVIHLRKPHISSNIWGVSCLPVVLNVDILEQIKIYDYNNFRNGLMIDYFLIVEGGSLRDNAIEDKSGNVVYADAVTKLEQALEEAKGNAASHGAILIESENQNVKIRLEPLRQAAPEGAFLSLKKDLRDGIFSYFRVPPRLVSQITAGQIGGGGEIEGQMKEFYYGVVKPLQNQIALILSRNFREEYGWNVDENSWDFGNLEHLFMDPMNKLLTDTGGQK